jgi:3-hydroxyacyl-CoA dehydrogenase
MEIRKAAVIGAGVMGGGIAAQIANAGIPVVLLDRAAEGSNRRAIVEGALARLIKSEPAAFMSKASAKLLTLGTVEDDLHLVADADWIVEAVLEDRAVKRRLYDTLETVRKAGSIVSSNTSTIPLNELTAGMPKRFRQDFLITHFFNPPRYMRLLEIVAGPETREEAAEAMANFADLKLGKGVVFAKDRPGFVANRIGVYWLQSAVVEALDLGLTVEEADVVMSRPLGFPKNRRIWPDGSGRARPAAACRCFDGGGVTEGRCLPRNPARFPADDQAHRRGLYRPQGQGRLLPSRSQRRGQGQAGDRPCYGHVSHGAEATL